MKKNLKYIIITLAVVLVLGGALAFLMLTKPGENEESTASSSSVVSEVSSSDLSLISRELSTLESFKVKNQYGEFTVDVKSGSDGDASFSIKGYEDYDIKTDTVSTAAQDVYNLTASKEITDVKDLAEFGLKGDTAITVSAEFKDGESEEIVIGSASASSSTSHYVLYKDKVFVCTTNTMYESGIENLVNPTGWSITTAADSSSAASGEETVSKDNLKDFSLKIKGGEDVEMNYDESQGIYLLSSPINILAPEYYVVDFIATFKELTPASTYKVKASEEDLKACGLDEPEFALSFKLNGESHSCNVGTKDLEGNRYITIDGDETVIYLISEDNITWIKGSSTSQRGGLVYMRNISDLSELNIDIGGEKADIKFTRSEKDSSTETSKSYNYTVTVNGEDKTYSGVTTTFYSSLISTAILNMEEKEYTGEALVTVKYHYWNGGSDTLEFYQAKDNSERLVAIFNGEYIGTVRATSIETLKKDFKTYMADDSFQNENQASSETTESSDNSEN